MKTVGNKSFWRTSFAVLGALVASQTVAFAESDMASLISLYDQGDYADVLTKLKIATKSKLKHSPIAHYYLARAYLMNRRLVPARAEYLKTYEMDPDGAIGKLSLDALIVLENDSEKKKQYSEKLAQLTTARSGLTLRRSRIDFVLPNGPAAKSGLRAQDEVISIDGVATHDLDTDSMSLLFRGRKDTTVPVIVKRQGEEVSLEVVRSDISIKPKSDAEKKQLAEIALSEKKEVSGEEADSDAPEDEAKSASHEERPSSSKGLLEHLDKSRKLSHLIDEPSASDNPVQLVMRAAALKAIAALQTDEIKAELLSKVKPLYDTALVLLNKRIAERPFESDLYAIRAHIYDANAEYQKGIDEYNFLKQFGVDNPLFVYAKARDEDGLKHYEAAAADYLQFARMNLSEKSHSKIESDGDEETFKSKHSLIAITPISAALNLPNGSASGYLGAASDYLNLSNNDKVVEICSEGLQKNPGEPNLLLRRAEALYAKQDYEKALDDCNVAFNGLRKTMFGIAVDTEIGAYALRAKIYRNLGRDREAAIDEETCSIVSGTTSSKSK